VRAAVPDPSGRIVAVIRHGAIDELTVEGIARADTGEALRRSSLCYVGSLAKQFVAACASSLVADGAIDPDAPVAAYVEGLPAWANTVRVRHLVHHTAGIPDRDRGGPPPPPRGVRAIGNDDVMADIRALDATAFPPGSRYAYSNRGYQLLGQAVSAAARRSLADTAADRLFGPLGMTATFFRDRETPLPPEAARGHFVANDGGIYVEPARFHAVGAGGLWTTVDDLARWDAASYDEGSIASRLARRGALDDGTPIHYGWGLSVRTHRGLPIHSHGGSFPGWASKMVRFPTERTAVLILANGETGDVSADAFELADRVLADAIDPAAPHADETFDGVR
jgi:CubicO group peptidase (beta-lactamase class C family)